MSARLHNNSMRFGLKESTIIAINSVFANYSALQKVVIYGSCAKGNYRNGSDIDLTLMGDSLTYTQLNRIETNIGAVFWTQKKVF